MILHFRRKSIPSWTRYFGVKPKYRMIESGTCVTAEYKFPMVTITSWLGERTGKRVPRFQKFRRWMEGSAGR